MEGCSNFLKFNEFSNLNFHGFTCPYLAHLLLGFEKLFIELSSLLKIFFFTLWHIFPNFSANRNVLEYLSKEFCLNLPPPSVNRPSSNLEAFLSVMLSPTDIQAAEPLP